MRFQPKARNAVLVAALAAVAATAWATNDMTYHSTYVPAYTVAVEEPAPEAVVVNESLAPNENVVIAAEEPAAPVVIERSTAYQPAITIEQRRLSNDERIQAQVMDRLAGIQNISGKIGVESNDAVVRLTGYTATNGQAYRAGREASSVMGVRYVQNEIRPRVGGSV